MTIRLILHLALVATASVWFVQAGQQQLYPIKSRPITDYGQALGILRRFVHPNLTKVHLCQRYVVLLKAMSTDDLANGVDQLYIQQLGLTKAEQVSKDFAKLDLTTVRQLYILGINKMREGVLDKSILELVSCLSDFFKLTDINARSYLNSRDLKQTLEQFVSVLSQPSEFLINPGMKHPLYTFTDLTPTVQRYVIHLFGSESAARSHFDGVEPNEPPRETTSIKMQSSDQVPSRHHQVRADSNNQGHARAVASTQVAHEAPQVVEASSGHPPEQKQARPAKQARKHKPEPKTQSEPEGLPAQVEPSSMDSGASKAEANSDSQLSDNELDYLQNLIESLGGLYRALPASAPLGDRCEAYSKLFKAASEELTEQYVANLAGEVNQMAAEAESEQAYVPEKSVRDNFLFSLTEFGPQGLTDEVYVDMIVCTLPWKDLDEDVANFLSQPDPAAIVGALTGQ